MAKPGHDRYHGEMGDLRGCPPELKDHHEGNVVDQLGPLVGVLAIYTHQIWSLTHVYFPFDGDFGYGSDLVKIAVVTRPMQGMNMKGKAAKTQSVPTKCHDLRFPYRLHSQKLSPASMKNPTNSVESPSAI